MEQSEITYYNGQEYSCVLNDTFRVLLISLEWHTWKFSEIMHYLYLDYVQK